jgi:short-subunit dehydrogenase
VAVLVNNAGFGWYGYYHDMQWESVQSMIRLNAEAVAHLTSLFLKPMRESNAGYIINVGSIAGDLPNQGIAAYGATKAFVSAFSTALYRELRYTGIHISLLLPGPVATELFDRASSLYGSRRIPAERMAVSAESVAARAWTLLKRPRRLAYVPAWLGIAPWLALSFNWLIDQLGPVLLARKNHS